MEESTAGKRIVRALGRPVRGVAAAVRAYPAAFAAVALAVFVLDVLLPPLVLSVARKPVDFFTFNPWLSRLPAYLASETVPLGRKLEFLPNLALFWFSADSPYGGTEWGFAVDVADLGRFALMSVLFGAYFALWRDVRARLGAAPWGPRTARRGGVAGALTSVLGFTTGPCSVMGCGAPVLPVVGLAFVGLSSGTLALLAQASRVGTALVLLAMTVAVAYLAWLAGGAPRSPRSLEPAR